MICFRDMTFCEHWLDCALAPNCRRPLTDEVKQAADRWWGKPGAPIAVWTEKPKCHVPIASTEPPRHG